MLHLWALQRVGWHHVKTKVLQGMQEIKEQHQQSVMFHNFIMTTSDVLIGWNFWLFGFPMSWSLNDLKKKCSFSQTMH